MDNKSQSKQVGQGDEKSNLREKMYQESKKHPFSTKGAFFILQFQANPPQEPETPGGEEMGWKALAWRNTRQRWFENRPT